MSETAYTPRFSLSTVHDERIKTNPNECYSDAAFRAALAEIEQELIAQGKPLRSDALRDYMADRRERRVSTPKLTRANVYMIRERVPKDATWKDKIVKTIATELGVQPETVLKCARRQTHTGVE